MKGAVGKALALDAVQAVATIVRDLNAARITSASLDRAEQALQSAMRGSSDRRGFLVELAADRQGGSLHPAARTRLLVAAARVLRGEGDFLNAVEHLLGGGG